MPVASQIMWFPLMVATSYWFYIALQPRENSRPAQRWKEAGITLLVILLPAWMLTLTAMLLWAVGIITLWIFLQHTAWVRAPLPLTRLVGMYAGLFLFGWGIGKWGLNLNNVLITTLAPLLEWCAIQPLLLWQIAVHTMGVIWSIWGGTLFVRTVLDPFGKSTPTVNEAELRRGRMIGNLERLLIYILALLQVWSLVSVTVAVKAIARFKKLEEQQFAEYFLIGTLSSLLFSVITIVWVMWLIHH